MRSLLLNKVKILESLFEKNEIRFWLIYLYYFGEKHSAKYYA